MDSKAKIPTLLGLGIIMVGLAMGIFLANQNQILKSKASPSVEPKNVTLVNLSATHASIYWQTQAPTSGFVQLGTSPLSTQTFRDERDLQAPQNHQLHFVTLTDLQPETVYYYKINSGILTYPDQDTLNFKTLPRNTSLDVQPLIGTVVDQYNKPVTEAIITLQIPNAQKLAAITKIGGSFVLPLNEIYPLSPQTEVLLNPQLKAEMTIFSSENQSKITLNPFSTSLISPPLIVGENKDLTIPTAVPTTLTPQAPSYDLNKDGKVNSLDRSLIIKNFGSNPALKTADLNQDGVVNNQDLQLLDKATRR